MISDERSNSHTTLVIAPGKMIQLFFRDGIHGYPLLKSQFPDGAHVIAARISQYENPFYRLARLQGLDNGLAPDDKGLFLSSQNSFRAKIVFYLAAWRRN